MPLIRSRQQVFKTRPLDNENGLASRWLFEGGRAFDFGTAQNSGVLIGSPPAVAGPAARNGLSFDGSTQNVQTSTNFGDASSVLTFTLSAWFKSTSIAGTSFICMGDLQDGSSDTTDRWLYLSKDGEVSGYIYDGGAKSILSATGYNDGNWHMATLVCTSGVDIRVYVDGLLGATPVSVGSPYTGYANSWWSIARNGTSGATGAFGGRFTGSLYDVRVYNRALTASEINTEFNRVKAEFQLRPDEWEMPSLQAASASSAVTLTAAKGTFTETGVNALFRINCVESKGTFTETGRNALFDFSQPSPKGTFTKTGQSALFRINEVFGKGTFTLTGIDAILKIGTYLTAATGTFTMSGKNILFQIDSLDSKGTFNLSGKNANLTPSMVSSKGTFSEVGKAVIFDIDMNMAKGTFILTGKDATLTDTGGPAPSVTSDIMLLRRRRRS